MPGPAALVVPALKRHTSTVIVAHGLGDSGAGWAFLAEHLRKRPLFSETKFIFPNAPMIPVTVNMGMRMPAWYDIRDFGDLTNRTDDEEGIKRSQKVLHALIDEEVKNGIQSDRVVLGGFSQGGAMALVSGVTCEKKLGGIFGLSCYLPLESKIKQMVLDLASNANEHTPIFMGHGEEDLVVKYQWGRMTAEKLKQLGYNVDFNSYSNLPHSASMEEIDDLQKWLEGRIPSLGDNAGGSL